MTQGILSGALNLSFSCSLADGRGTVLLNTYFQSAFLHNSLLPVGGGRKPVWCFRSEAGLEANFPVWISGV